MPPPVIGSFAQRLVAAVTPMMYAEEENGWPHHIYLGAIGDTLFQEIEDLASDNLTTGAPGWSKILDVDETPDKALPWLGQFVGAQFAGGLTPADQRDQLHNLPNWKRGAEAAMYNAAKPYLTGTKAVIFRERDPAAAPNDPAYGTTIITQASETPDSAAVLAALLRQKPAGIILNYQVLAGVDLEEVYLDYATLGDIYTTFVSLYGFMTNQPGV